MAAGRFKLISYHFMHFYATKIILVVRTIPILVNGTNNNLLVNFISALDHDRTILRQMLTTWNYYIEWSYSN